MVKSYYNAAQLFYQLFDKYEGINHLPRVLKSDEKWDEVFEPLLQLISEVSYEDINDSRFNTVREYLRKIETFADGKHCITIWCNKASEMCSSPDPEENSDDIFIVISSGRDTVMRLNFGYYSFNRNEIVFDYILYGRKARNDIDGHISLLKW